MITLPKHSPCQRDLDIRYKQDCSHPSFTSCLVYKTRKGEWRFISNAAKQDTLSTPCCASLPWADTAVPEALALPELFPSLLCSGGSLPGKINLDRGLKSWVPKEALDKSKDLVELISSELLWTSLPWEKPDLPVNVQHFYDIPLWLEVEFLQLHSWGEYILCGVSGCFAFTYKLLMILYFSLLF